MRSGNTAGIGFERPMPRAETHCCGEREVRNENGSRGYGCLSPVTVFLKEAVQCWLYPPQEIDRGPCQRDKITDERL